jgi:hypothetical protein
MDRTPQRFAYRCIPLSIANASGWEVLTPYPFTATWTGDRTKDGVILQSPVGLEKLNRIAVSHFGEGVLTFHTGYLFRTNPGWALWARGAPNTVKDGIVPLDGLVETDWLPFPFTMNWRFTRPGTVQFGKDEPFCFITPFAHAQLDEVTPELRHLDDDPTLKAAYQAWSDARAEFNTRLASREPEAVKQGWQRHYVRGNDPTDISDPTYHLSKRRLHAPKLSETSRS